MTDLSKCSGVDCPLRDSGFRYTSPMDKLFQSHIDTAYDGKRNFCWHQIKERALERFKEGGKVVAFNWSSHRGR